MVDPLLDRRSVLKAATVGTVAGVSLATTAAPSAAAPAVDPVFAHGVASGDITERSTANHSM